MAERYIQIVFSNPVEGEDDEFNEWYDNVHIPELLAVPGMLSAQRYNLHDAEMYRMEGGRPPEQRYCLIYEMEGDVDAVMAEIQKRVAEGKIHMADCLDMSSWRLSFWDLRGSKVNA